MLGYHGCDVNVAERVVSGSAKLKHSRNDYDWLGDDVYFWEQNAQRAFDFAVEVSKRPHPSNQTIEKPAVVGAIIDFGYCLNLLDSRYISMVADAFADLEATHREANLPLPINRGGHDLVDRKLDCAVLTYLHETREDADLPQFDTVRGVFVEGNRLYDNAGFAARSHNQIAVRQPARIVGLFHPLDEKGKRRKFKVSI